MNGQTIPCGYKMECYSASTRNELLTHAAMWMSTENNMLIEKSEEAKLSLRVSAIHRPLGGDPDAGSSCVLVSFVGHR